MPRATAHTRGGSAQCKTCIALQSMRYGRSMPMWRDDSTLTLYRDLFRLLDGVDRLKGEGRILVAIAAEEFVLEFDPLQAERM